MKQQRAYQYRCYPTPEQAQILSRTFGCARYVYNFALRLRTDAYYQEQKRIGYRETSAELTKLKQQTPWLNEVASVPLQQSLRHLDRGDESQTGQDSAKQEIQPVMVGVHRVERGGGCQFTVSHPDHCV